MSVPPAVADIETYLRDRGWRQQPERWREATVWSHAGGYQVLLPPRDDLGDTELRVREILTTLTTVEQRPVDEIAGDIDSPFADVQSYRTFPGDLPPGFISLIAGVAALNGVREAMAAAARTVLEGPRPSFSGRSSEAVRRLLQLARLGPSFPGSHAVTVRVPLDVPLPLPVAEPWRPPQAGEPLARQVAGQLYDAVDAVRAATEQGGDPAAFHELAAVGVSANMCYGLAAVAGGPGQRYRLPFEVEFRWGRGVVSELRPTTISFAAGTGELIQAAAVQLRQLHVTGEATMAGVVEGLHDDPAGADRWRIKVRGELTTARSVGERRGVWVSVGSQTRYDQAIIAHQARQRVRVTGELTAVRGRVELVVGSDGFQVLD